MGFSKLKNPENCIQEADENNLCNIISILDIRPWYYSFLSITVKLTVEQPKNVTFHKQDI